MEIDVLHQQLLPDTFCPLCQHPMFDMEANIYGRMYAYLECSSNECQHQIFPQQDRICYCQHCQVSHKKELAKSSQEELHKKNKNIIEANMTDVEQLSFLDKLFLLSVLENHVSEDLTHQEYITWHRLKYTLITPNYYYQKQMIKKFIQAKYLISTRHTEQEQYYIHLRLNGEEEPNLNYLTMNLRQYFYHDLTQLVPFHTAEDVKSAMYELMYQQIIQYCQFICKAWKVPIAGNRYFEKLCYQLLEHFALLQIFYFMSRALNYLKQAGALQSHNEQFINTNLLRKTVQSYFDTAMSEKWETYSIAYPEQMPMSTMSYILFVRFLHLQNELYEQPIWKLWQNIQPRLNFYAHRRCIHCGSTHLITEYDDQQHISLICLDCQQQNNYFI